MSHRSSVCIVPRHFLHTSSTRHGSASSLASPAAVPSRCSRHRSRPLCEMKTRARRDETRRRPILLIARAGRAARRTDGRTDAATMTEHATLQRRSDHNVMDRYTRGAWPGTAGSALATQGDTAHVLNSDDLGRSFV